MTRESPENQLSLHRNFSSPAFFAVHFKIAALFFTIKASRGCSIISGRVDWAQSWDTRHSGKITHFILSQLVPISEYYKLKIWYVYSKFSNMMYANEKQSRKTKLHPLHALFKIYNNPGKGKAFKNKLRIFNRNSLQFHLPITFPF